MTAVLFAGQGAVRPGMARALLARSPAARKLFTDASAILGRGIAAMIEDGTDLIGPVESHLALVSTGLACWRALVEEQGLSPVLLAGHSLGEITALACAGALPLDQALALAERRGALLAQAAVDKPGVMTAILGLPADAVEQACAASLDVGLVGAVNYNTDAQTVIAGEVGAVDAAAERCRAMGGQAVRLATAAAFHTPLVAEVAVPLYDFARSLDWRTPSIPVISSRTGRPLPEPSGLAAALALQVALPVRWTRVQDTLNRAGVRRLICATPAEPLVRMTMPGVETLPWDAVTSAERHSPSG